MYTQSTQPHNILSTASNIQANLTDQLSSWLLRFAFPSVTHLSFQRLLSALIFVIKHWRNGQVRWKVNTHPSSARREWQWWWWCQQHARVEEFLRVMPSRRPGYVCRVPTHTTLACCGSCHCSPDAHVHGNMKAHKRRANSSSLIGSYEAGCITGVPVRWCWRPRISISLSPLTSLTRSPTSHLAPNCSSIAYTQKLDLLSTSCFPSIHSLQQTFHCLR